ncbi:MAG TPA: hypothetical protein PKW54_01365 [Ferruginibacter sp.]|nr:hypothetical protein [Ferruginibacter sp.]
MPIVQKLLMICVFAYILYWLFAILYFFWLSVSLQKADIDKFREVLGGKCQYKYVNNEIRRYKWDKYWVVLRAHFTDDGKRVKKPFRFLFDIRHSCIF